MTVHWTKAQAAKYFDQSTPAPQPSTPRHKALRERVAPPEGPQVRVGCIGGTQHKWRWDKSSECWLSVCGQIGTSKTPDGKRGKRECALCKEETL